MSLDKLTTEQLRAELQRREQQDEQNWKLECKEASVEISDLIDTATRCIDRAVLIADKYGLYFTWDACGYGMGGGYQGIGKPDANGWSPSNIGWQHSLER